MYTYFANLIRAGLLVGLIKVSKGVKAPFPQLRKALNLMVEDLDPKDPSDAAYVFSGYAPISIRLVEAALRSVCLTLPHWSKSTTSACAQQLSSGCNDANIPSPWLHQTEM